MIIDCIADLHGFFPRLNGGDLLIVAGDVTARHTMDEWCAFLNWAKHLDYDKVVFVGGNHDTFLDHQTFKLSDPFEGKFEYLCDSGTEFQGLKIWGSPWTLTFKGISPKCTAFTGVENDLQTKWDLIPRDTDILITHGPSFGVLDGVKNRTYNPKNPLSRITLNTGSPSLWLAVNEIKPKLHVFGHIHEHGGKRVDVGSIAMINCSYVDEKYRPIHKSVRVIL